MVILVLLLLILVLQFDVAIQAKEYVAVLLPEAAGAVVLSSIVQVRQAVDA